MDLTTPKSRFSFAAKYLIGSVELSRSKTKDLKIELKGKLLPGLAVCDTATSVVEINKKLTPLNSNSQLIIQDDLGSGFIFSEVHTKVNLISVG